jgi:hypothetical protein
VTFAVDRDDMIDPFPVDLHPRDPASGMYLATGTRDNVDERVCQLLAAADEAGGPIDVQLAHERVNVSGRLVAITGIEGIAKGKHVPQALVGGKRIDKLANTAGEKKEVIGPGGRKAEVIKLDLVAKRVKRVNVSPDILLLAGKLGRKRFDKPRGPARRLVAFPVARDVKKLETLLVSGQQREALHDAEVGTKTIERPARVEGPGNVHAGLEGDAVTTKLVQATTDSVMLFKNPDTEPLFCQDRAAK